MNERKEGTKTCLRQEGGMKERWQKEVKERYKIHKKNNMIMKEIEIK